MKRTLLGRFNSLTHREAVYELDDGLEIEAREQYEVLQRRVLWEDVLYITYHRRIGVLYTLVMGGLMLFFLAMMAMLLAINEAGAATSGTAAAFGAMAMVFMIALLVRVLLRVDVVSVFGRRSHAAVRFSFRKRRARQLYEQLCTRTRLAQRKLQAELEREERETIAPPVDPETAPPMPEWEKAEDEVRTQNSES